MKRNQEGYFLLLAVIFIMVIGVMGVIIANVNANRAMMSVSEQKGMQAYYIAQSGLEVASRLLVGSSLVSGQEQTCATLTGSALVTNTTLLNGTFTATAVGGGLYSASTTLSAAITSTSNSLILADVTGFAAHGRVRIDSEAIDYASISGSQLVGLNRGAAGTTAASHSTGAAVSESVCLVNVKAGIPSIAAPQYQRELEVAVEIIGGSDVWMVGARHGNLFSIIRWNLPSSSVFNDWSYSDVSNRANLNNVSLSSTTNGWAVGDIRSSRYTIINWNGSSWTSTPLAGACTGVNLLGVATTSTSEAWAVGVRYRPGCASSGNFRYTMLKYNGSSWSVLTPSTSPSLPSDASGNQNLNEISVYDNNGDGFADYGFAVGDSGTILRYTGSSWVSSASGVSNNLLAVTVVSGTEAWAVGASGRILKWNGTSWSSVSSPTSNQLNGISMVDTNGDGKADIGWAVGNSGTIIYYNGSSWSTQSSSTTNNLFAIAAVSSSSAFAGGASNTVLQWNGSSWATVTNPALAVQYNGAAVIRGNGSVTGTQVGSWLQNFN